MTVKANASISLKFSNSKQLVAVITALTPETVSLVNHRANVVLQVNDCFLVLHITAEDTVALRVMTNVYLRWIASIMNITKVIDCMQ